MHSAKQDVTRSFKTCACSTLKLKMNFNLKEINKSLRDGLEKQTKKQMEKANKGASNK